MHPNIIFIFSDQQRHRTTRIGGNPLIQTPNLDRLGTEGAYFENAFSSCPICSPYRAQVMTGRYAHANGVPCNEYKLFDDQAFFSQVCKDAGYRTGFFGKWHLGYPPYSPDKRYGFDVMNANNCFDNQYDVPHNHNEEDTVIAKEWSPTFETNAAIRFLNDCHDQAPDAPFLMMMSWTPPHWPYDQYPDRFKLYDPADIELPPSVPEELREQTRRETADYFGGVSAIDHELGRVLDWLDEHGLTQNTIVAYSSDHGDHIGAHGYGKAKDKHMPRHLRASKQTPYEESIHVPFLLRYPEKMDSGQRPSVLFNSVDVMPTLLGLAGLPVPDSVQGRDLSGSVRGERIEEPDSAYFQILGPGWPNRGLCVGYWRAVRTHRWTYARWQKTNEVWLFDLENDPHQMTNLADDPAHKPVRDELETRLRQWLRETEDPFETGKRDPKTGMLILGQQLTDRPGRKR